jgi:phage repressor protein C with HTH and peptisase S24 domain
MLTHAQIWMALDRLAVAAGLSPSGLAKRAGLDPTTFNKSKRITTGGRARWPSTESVAKALTATGTSLDTFVQLVGDTGRPATPRTVPSIALDLAGQPGLFDASGFPTGPDWQELRLPAAGDDHAYGLEIRGSSLDPAYPDGTIIIVSPAAAVRHDDRVVVKTRDGRLVVRQLKRRTARGIELCPLDAAGSDELLLAGDVAWIARIIWASQ